MDARSTSTGREMVLGPLNPAEVGEMLGLDPARPVDRSDPAAAVAGDPVKWLENSPFERHDLAALHRRRDGPRPRAGDGCRA
ncbi:hypothetical protein [Nocardia sp. NPDC005366]|uniref:hypothetical protein n=1 Tax=Nocardia sp. NPDC005366 TaxID=3156878 RepID=UPI0033B81750